MEGPMRKSYSSLLLILILAIVTGCAVKVVPEAVPGGMISSDNKSLSLTRSGVTITVGAVDEEIFTNTEGLLTSLQVEINNGGESEVFFNNDSFILVSADNRQYFSIPPEKVRQMVTKETYYLLPYPYVGFYYLEDYEKAAFKNSTNSTTPYYYELYPENIFARALPMTPVIPKAKISGLLYFQADLAALQAFSLQIYRMGSSKSAPPEFSFPFKIVK